MLVLFLFLKSHYLKIHIVLDYIYSAEYNIQNVGSMPCVDLPSDPPDDSNDVFDDGPTSAINVFNLAMEGEDRFVTVIFVMESIGLCSEYIV